MAKPTKTNISGLEKQLLKQYSKSAPLVLVRSKAQAILLASNGVAIASIADVLDKKPRTVKLWLRKWCERRLGSLFTGHKDNNNAGKLTPEQKVEIQQALQSPPSDFGLPKEFWDVSQLKEYVTTQFGVVYECDQSYHFLLKFSNLSFKYADTFDRRRDELFITERIKTITAELAPLLSSDEWEVFACDEVRMDQEAIIRRAWLERGEKTVVKVNRNKESQSYIGFLNQKNGICEIFEMPWQNSAEVLKACELFLARHPEKRLLSFGTMQRFIRARLYVNNSKKADFYSGSTSLPCLPMLQTTTPLSMCGELPSRPLQMCSIQTSRRRSRLSPASSQAEHLSLGFSRFCF